MRAIYSIEGNIGSGKSTFLSLLKTYQPKIHAIPQPVAQWQKVSNRFNLLEQYYKNPNRWAFTFQINAILSRVKELKKLFQIIETQKQKDKIYFCQRSIIADRQIFAKLLYKQGKMNQMQYSLYVDMYDSLQRLFKTPRIHKFIYLKTTPKKCMQRMTKRARQEQINIKMDYLQKIHQLHEDWLGKQNNKLVINGEEEFQDNQKKAKEMAVKVKKFLQL